MESLRGNKSCLEVSENKREEISSPSSTSRQPSPCLLIHHGKRNKNQTLFNVSSGRYQVRSMPEFRGKMAWGFYHGWLLLGDSKKREWFLLNLLSKEKIVLPSLKRKPLIKTCVWSSPPEDPDCMIYVFYVDQSYFYYCRPRDNKWNRQKFDADHYFTNAVTCKGKIYLQTEEGNVAVIEVDRVPNVRLLLMPNTTVGVGCFVGNHVVESEGEIFQVCLIYYGFQPIVRDCIVYKLDLVGRRLERVESIGDRVFFIGCLWSISYSASELKIKGNRIYYTLSYDLSLYNFDLEDGSITADLPWPNMHPPWDYDHWVLA